MVTGQDLVTLWSTNTNDIPMGLPSGKILNTDASEMTEVPSAVSARTAAWRKFGNVSHPMALFSSQKRPRIPGHFHGNSEYSYEYSDGFSEAF